MTSKAIQQKCCADDADVGTIYVGAGAGIIITLGVGEGLRGATTLKGTPITAAGF